jgi:hypothetical protein
MRCLTGGALLALFLAAAPAAQTPSALPELLAAASAHFDNYITQVAGIVCEEDYVQDVLSASVVRLGARGLIVPVHRTLRSDLLLVRVNEGSGWMQFRDVFEVDGEPVRDRTDRLAKLFLQPSSSIGVQIEAISKESARYNIGDVVRTINVPLLGLRVLNRRLQPNFRFHIDSPGDAGKRLPKSPSFAVPPGVVVLSFDETRVPRTMVRSPNGKNIPSRGRIWMNPAGPRIVMTELRVNSFPYEATIHVAYGDVPGIEVPMPVEMHELYLNLSASRRVEGAARYSNFRKFHVQVDEALVPDRRDDR